MPLTIVQASKASKSPEILPANVFNSGSMEPSMKKRFKTALGLPARMKTFGIDLVRIGKLKEEADNLIEGELVSKGLYRVYSLNNDYLLNNENENFEKMGSTTISLGSLYNNQEIALEFTADNKVKTSFILNVGNEPIVFSSISKDRKVNFFSLIYAARFLNSLQREYLIELMKRKKGIIIATAQSNAENIPSSSCLIYELVLNNNGEISYKELPNEAPDVQKAFQEHTLVNIIYGL